MYVADVVLLALSCLGGRREGLRGMNAVPYGCSTERAMSRTHQPQVPHTKHTRTQRYSQSRARRPYPYHARVSCSFDVQCADVYAHVGRCVHS